MDTKSVPLENKNKIEQTENETRSVVAVCLGTGGIAAGGDKVFKKFEDEIKKLSLDAAIGKRICRTAKTGCRGLCARDVLVDVTIPGLETLTYERVTVDMVPQIIEEHLIKNTPVNKWLAKEDYHKFHDSQQRLVLANCGIIDPENIDEYIARGGYTALKKVLETMAQQDVIQEIKKSGLRGRGGGVFQQVKNGHRARNIPLMRNLSFVMLTKATLGLLWIEVLWKAIPTQFWKV